MFTSVLSSLRHRLLALVGLALVSCVFAVAPHAAESEFQRGPVPHWVERHEPLLGVEPPIGQVVNGAYYLLADYQTQIDAAGRVAYRHFAATALSEKGVDSLANIEIGYDPSYQTLVLHQLQLIREGRVISQLDSVDVRLLQREAELEARIVDGSKSASIFLDDVRVGDIVEYAYSVKGSNPVFNGLEFGGLPLQWSQPLEQLRARLRVASGRPIEPVVINSELRSRVEVSGSYREYHWRQDNVPALRVENDSPRWFDPYPNVQWSEFPDWQAVAQWALPLYQAQDKLPPALQPLVLQIRSSTNDAEAGLLKALRLVQGEVRYLGIEIGAGSHAPSAPEVVYKRRFGDCKDKTLLLLTLLKALGIEANAALVSTDRLIEGDGRPVSPGWFNHVIVQARLGKHVYWLDPTRPVQPSSLATLYQPDFGKALLVDQQSRSLVSMAEAPNSRRKVHVLIDSRAGFDAPATMHITTNYHGAAAEQMRDRFAGASTDELRQQYLNYYASYYRGIQSAAAIEVSDLQEHNQVTLVERYEVPEFWPAVENSTRREAQVEMPDIRDYLSAPDSTHRVAPVALNHPIEVTLTTELLLPEPWPLSPETITIDDPHFSFSHSLNGEESRFLFTETYRSLADHVPAAAVSVYADNLQRARAQLGYQLSFTPEADSAALPWAERINWMLAFVAMLLTVIYVWGAWLFYRYDPAPRSGGSDPQLTGIGGWLVLPALSSIVSPFVLAYAIYETLPALSIQQWSILTQPGSESYHAGWAPLLLFELASNMAMLIFSLLLALLFFQKRSNAPAAFITLLAGAPLLIGIKLALIETLALPTVEATHSDWVEVVGGLLELAVWGTYFLVSVRVKQTFTRRLHASPLTVAARATDDEPEPSRPPAVEAIQKA